MASVIVEVHEQAYEEWAQVYMRIAAIGWKNMPTEFADIPVEERVGILRGMMVDAGKSGLLPSLNQVLDILTARAKPRSSLAEEKAPTEIPKEAPKPAEPGQQKLAEPPESVPSPGTKPTARAEPFATEKQVNAIKKFCETPKLKGVVAETLRKTGKPNVGQLSIAEASDLVGRLIDLSSGRIPLGAKVETGVKT